MGMTLRVPKGWISGLRWWSSGWASISLLLRPLADFLPALPALGRDFGAGAAQIQLTLSAFLLGLALGQIVAGPIGHKGNLPCVALAVITRAPSIEQGADRAGKIEIGNLAPAAE